MSMRYSFRLGILLLTLCALFEASYAEVPLLKDKDRGAIVGQSPIVITSAKLKAENNTALFEGSVVAKTDNMTLYSDKMLVFYSQEGKVSKIEADGNVRLIREGKVLTSSKALYIAGEEKIIFTGEPKAVEGENVVTGSKITYIIKEGRSIIENSRVILRQEE